MYVENFFIYVEKINFLIYVEKIIYFLLVVFVCFEKGRVFKFSIQILSIFKLLFKSWNNPVLDEIEE